MNQLKILQRADESVQTCLAPHRFNQVVPQQQDQIFSRGEADPSSIVVLMPIESSCPIAHFWCKLGIFSLARHSCEAGSIFMQN